jgi:hypothetical protein
MCVLDMATGKSRWVVILVNESIVGVVRAQHPFLDKNGNRYIALGTDKFLLLYFEGQLFDISPFDAARTTN